MILVTNMYNLKKIGKKYLETSRNLLQYYRELLALNDEDNLIGFPAIDDTSLSFECNI